MWYTYWMACVEGITGGRKCELCRKNGSAEAVYYIEEKGIREQTITEKEWEILKESKKKRNWREAYQKAVDRGIQMAVRGQKNYPKRLEELAGMPYALFFIGEMPQEGIPSVAVVGARRCSSYGEKMTLRFVERLAESGIQIISGMALGIDGMAHRAALNVGGKTFAVLGGGADVCYPAAHKGLYNDLIKRGGILSEQPPGTPPVAWHFPARNRLISGLADVVLVMEAKEAGVPIISSMGAGNKLDPTAFEVADIYKTTVCPLARVMRRELKKRGVKKLKVVYSKEQPTRPIEDMSISCRSHCVCPPGTVHKCTERRDIPGSIAFVPSVAGLILAGEVIKDLTK